MRALDLRIEDVEEASLREHYLALAREHNDRAVALHHELHRRRYKCQIRNLSPAELRKKLWEYWHFGQYTERNGL